MSKTTKRKRYTGAFKAKVGLEALMGIKTVGQIAREYQVHPVQVTQWKGVIRDHLPELFESPQAASQDQEQLIAQLHEKIGQLLVFRPLRSHSLGRHRSRAKCDRRVIRSGSATARRAVSRQVSYPSRVEPP